MMLRCDSCAAALASRKNRSRCSGLTVELAGNDLDSDDTGQQRVEGLVDRPHAALAELLGDFVATDAIQDAAHCWDLKRLLLSVA